MSRNDDNSEIHFFTTHFFTKLETDGPEALANWTGKKGIDIFKKKMIFVPVNKQLHWSFCAVINPGSIRDHKHNIEIKKEITPEDMEKPFPFLFFFDSLKAHRKAHVAKLLRKWLNSEWTRLQKASPSLATDDYESSLVDQDAEAPFTTKTIQAFDPKGKLSAARFYRCDEMTSISPFLVSSSLQYLTKPMAWTVVCFFAAIHTRFTNFATEHSRTRRWATPSDVTGLKLVNSSSEIAMNSTSTRKTFTVSAMK
jgi:hypothetical protein